MLLSILHRVCLQSLFTQERKRQLGFFICFDISQKWFKTLEMCVVYNFAWFLGFIGLHTTLLLELHLVNNLNEFQEAKTQLVT